MTTSTQNWQPNKFVSYSHRTIVPINLARQQACAASVVRPSLALGLTAGRLQGIETLATLAYGPGEYDVCENDGPLADKQEALTAQQRALSTALRGNRSKRALKAKPALAKPACALRTDGLTATTKSPRAFPQPRADRDRGTCCFEYDGLRIANTSLGTRGLMLGPTPSVREQVGRLTRRHPQHLPQLCPLTFAAS